MININQNKGKCSVCVEGNIIELASDTACILRSIYSAIHEGNHESAEEYARIVVRLIIDPDSDVFEPHEKEE